MKLGLLKDQGVCDHGIEILSVSPKVGKTTQSLASHIHVVGIEQNWERWG